jgi:hypothetical protein
MGMRVEKTDEPLKVRVDFEAGGLIRPLLLRRGGQVFRVRKVNGCWDDREGIHRIFYFSLSMDSGDVFQVAFRPSEACWRLTSVALDG